MKLTYVPLTKISKGVLNANASFIKDFKQNQPSGMLRNGDEVKLLGVVKDDKNNNLAYKIKFNHNTGFIQFDKVYKVLERKDNK